MSGVIIALESPFDTSSVGQCLHCVTQHSLTRESRGESCNVLDTNQNRVAVQATVLLVSYFSDVPRHTLTP